MTSKLLRKLSGGDARSIGRADEVAREVLDAPVLFDELFTGLHHDDELIRMRAADALEKVTARRPDWLAPYKARILRQLAAPEPPAVRWHLIQMAPRLLLTKGERRSLLLALKRHLTDSSSIVKTSAMQALVAVADDDQRLRKEIIPLLEEATSEGTAAMKSRGIKLLKGLKN